MDCIKIAPCEELKDFVSHFWFARWDEDTQHVPSTYFATANSLTEITFAYRGSKQSPELLFSSIQGQTATHAQYPAGGFFEMFGVSIFSHAVTYLFKIPASALNNAFIGLDTLFGNEAKTLIEKIAVAHSLNNRIKILTDSLRSKLRDSRFGDQLIIQANKRIRQCHGNINIEQLSEEFCYSHKQFNRRFREYSGFNPKMFSRIVRFESILKNHHHYASLTHAAHAYGYYDQAHLIRDFRSFSGFGPREFFKVSAQ